MMVALLALAATPLVGCHADTEAKAPVEIIVMDASGAATLPPGAASGRSPRLKAGEPEALWVGRLPSGEYFLRTTTRKAPHRFQGRIRAAAGGQLTNFRPTRMDFSDRFKLEGQDIVFDITTAGDEDGFDFGVSKNACVEFDTRIDGQKQPDKIIIGEKEMKTPSAHFTICP
jgi:hypothetical protein